MAEENDILESWEELDDNKVLNKKLKGIQLATNGRSSTGEGVSQMKEEGSRTQYTPQVRILKRQQDPNEQAKSNKSKEKAVPQKSLQQREAEYKEARLRILGHDYSGGDNNTNNSATIMPSASSGSLNNGADSPRSRPLRLQKAASEDTKVQLLREPKGPDGTGGFDQPR